MDNSPLARLPAELRTNIYELALIQSEPVSLSCQRCSKNEKHLTTEHHDLVSIADSLALARTCHEIRHESKLIYFAVNTFVLTHMYNPKLLQAAFLATLTNIPEEYMNAIRRVELRLGQGICFCEQCHHRLRNIHNYLEKLVKAVCAASTQYPQCRFALRTAFCCNSETSFELPIGQAADAGPWARAIEFIGDEVRWEYFGMYSREVRTRAQGILRDLRDRALIVSAAGDT